ncbi:hypothetical protein F3Y22_tig00110213pilonHSYRG00004 [Hibiscus syriacus]|uniref:Arabinogalactan peptide 23-like n=1 Tax=Hibiscus syriacus TaxID=106335 RepID=A0A6A3BAC5_HIBSY|nr:arabinogalactan protein 23-like [Hibiscus syriacus]KAE8713141.1 hypothetical protein F3Y22_tig00110213pilonHSYRG00004 [Hibiscus syriacus]
MDMKKISCSVIFAAASMSAVMAAGVAAPAATPSSAPGSSPLEHSLGGAAPASAPGPEANVAISTLPVLGSLVGAFLVSFFA